MPDETTPAKRGFVPGHPRWGGKKKGSASRVRDLVDQLGPSADPIRFQLLLIRDRTYQEVTIVDGKKIKTTVPAPLSLILEACKNVAQYYVPKLSAVAVTGEDGGPVETVSLNLTAIMNNPELAKQAQSVALALCIAGTQPRLETPIYPGLKAPEEQ